MLVIYKYMNIFKHNAFHSVYNELANLAKTPTFLAFFMINVIFRSILFSFNFLNRFSLQLWTEGRKCTSVIQHMLCIETEKESDNPDIIVKRISTK